jgi:two-component system, NarL family, sensor histidine kinase DegS
MTNVSLGRRFRAGPLTLIAAMASAIVLGAVGLYYYRGDAANLLYFFYIPVAAAGVVLGKRIGVCVASFAVAAVAVAAAWRDFGSRVFVDIQTTEKIATLVVWAVFLLAMAWLVGWVSERGGSLSLTQGLGARTISAIEKERRRTGQDIHDGIAQYAAAAFIETEVLGAMAVETAPEVQTQVERVRQPLSHLVEEARAMVGNLRPPALGPGEFISTFTQLVESFQSRTGIESQLDLEGDFAVHSDSMRICVYRTTQEALTNVERHSEATRVRVRARSSKGGVDLIVRDNGKGFEPKDHEDANGNGNGHYGLRGMEERAGYLGGRLVIRSAPGQGASIVVHVPAYRR